MVSMPSVARIVSTVNTLKTIVIDVLCELK